MNHLFSFAMKFRSVISVLSQKHYDDNKGLPFTSSASTFRGKEGWKRNQLVLTKSPSMKSLPKSIFMENPTKEDSTSSLRSGGVPSSSFPTGLKCLEHSSVKWTTVPFVGIPGMVLKRVIPRTILTPDPFLKDSANRSSVSGQVKKTSKASSPISFSNWAMGLMTRPYGECPLEFFLNMSILLGSVAFWEMVPQVLITIDPTVVLSPLKFALMQDLLIHTPNGMYGPESVELHNQLRSEYLAHQANMGISEYHVDAGKRALAYTVTSLLMVVAFNAICTSHLGA